MISFKYMMDLFIGTNINLSQCNPWIVGWLINFSSYFDGILLPNLFHELYKFQNILITITFLLQLMWHNWYLTVIDKPYVLYLIRHIIVIWQYLLIRWSEKRWNEHDDYIILTKTSEKHHNDSAKLLICYNQ